MLVTAMSASASVEIIKTTRSANTSATPCCPPSWLPQAFKQCPFCPDRTSSTRTLQQAARRIGLQQRLPRIRRQDHTVCNVAGRKVQEGLGLLHISLGVGV